MAIALARQCQATIYALYAVYAPSYSEFGFKGTLDKNANEKIKQVIESAKSKAAQNGISLIGKIVYGDASYQIVSFAHNKKNHIDLIVIGSRGRGQAKEMIFGSTANKVMHSSKIPILLVKWIKILNFDFLELSNRTIM